MSVTLAGSMGGVKKINEIGENTKFLINLLNSTSPKQLEEQWFNLMKEITVVSIATNNACNLKCKHCYLNTPLYDKPLSKDEWTKFLNSIQEIKPILITVSGKEFTIDPNKNFFLKSFQKLRNDEIITKFGFITNGILLHQMKDILLETSPDYVDISIDGINQTHDLIRGDDAFNKAFPNAIWCSQNFENLTFVNITIQKYNYDQLIDIFKTLIENDITNVAANFYKPLPYTDPNLTLSSEQINHVFSLLKEVKNLKSHKQFTFLLDLDHIYLPPILHFIKSDWFNPSKLKEDDNKSTVMIYEFPNNTKIIFRLNLAPIGISRIRITPDGFILAADDSVNTLNYKNNFIANMRDFNYNLRKLHEFAMNSKRLKQIFNDFINNELPLIKNALN